MAILGAVLGENLIGFTDFLIRKFRTYFIFTKFLNELQ